MGYASGGPDYREDFDMTTTRVSIWPGPECLRERAHRLEELAAEHGPFGALTRLRLLEQVERAESDRRTLGIAMCHAKARARVRMQRFLEWCRSHGACRRGLDYASARTSPEQAVLDSAESIYTAEHLNVAWCARRCSPEWDDRVEEARWADMYARWDRRPAHALTTVAEALVRSPEWASLPWQADPSEVTHA